MSYKNNFLIHYLLFLSGQSYIKKRANKKVKLFMSTTYTWAHKSHLKFLDICMFVCTYMYVYESRLQAAHIIYSYQCYKLMNNVVKFMLNIFKWPRANMNNIIWTYTFKHVLYTYCISKYMYVLAIIFWRKSFCSLAPKRH